jgi:hypothetical protein
MGTARGVTEAPIAFPSDDREIRVNFGLLSGREATSAEIEELANELHAKLGEFAIVAEHRFEFSGEVEASVHQVKIEFEEPLEDELRGRILEITERWANACAADRHAGVVESIDSVETP